MAFLVKILNFIFQPFLILLCFYLLKSQTEIQFNEMHAQISNLTLQLDSSNTSYNKCTCQMENATEGAIKEVTWWSWIWQSLVNVFWVVMALNNLFVGFIFFVRGPSILQ